MANDSCEPTPPPSEPVKPGTRMIMCAKIGKELPGLDRVPWKGELGQRVYDSISKDAWKLWVEYSKMVMNEYRLNPLIPTRRKSWASRWNNSSLARAQNYRKAMWRRRPRAKRGAMVSRFFPLPDARREVWEPK